MPVPEERHLFLQRIDRLAHPLHPPANEIDEITHLLLLLRLVGGAFCLFMRCGISVGRQAGLRLLDGLHVFLKKIFRVRPVRRCHGSGSRRAVHEVADGRGHPGGNQGINVGGRAPEACPVEQVGSLGVVPLVWREGGKHS